jgi:hypothetical protein
MERHELVDALRNLSEKAEQHGFKEVLMPHVLPIDMGDAKQINELILEGKLSEKYVLYDIPFLLRFIADMIEE